MNSGIYKLTCLVDGKVYVGRTNAFTRRRKQHLTCAKNAHLRNVISKYGRANFLFSVLCECTPEGSVEKEVLLIKEAELSGEPLYNTMKTETTGVLGHSADSKERMRSVKLGKKATEATRAKLSEAHLGVPKSEKHRIALAAHLVEVRPKALSEERKCQILAQLKGNMHALGKHWVLSDETKRKMSEAQTGNKKNLGRKQSPETTAKRKATILRKRWRGRTNGTHRRDCSTCSSAI